MAGTGTARMSRLLQSTTHSLLGPLFAGEPHTASHERAQAWLVVCVAIFCCKVPNGEQLAGLNVVSCRSSSSRRGSKALAGVLKAVGKVRQTLALFPFGRSRLSTTSPYPQRTFSFWALAPLPNVTAWLHVYDLSDLAAMASFVPLMLPSPPSDLLCIFAVLGPTPAYLVANRNPL